MYRHVIAIATSALLACSATIAGAQSTTAQPQAQPQAPASQPGSNMMEPHMMGPPTMMRRGGMMGGGMMGMMRGHRGMAGPMMRIIFALMDNDGDGTISLQEFQAAHERIFKAMDANKDGKLTLEEMQSFISGETKSTPSQSPPQ